MPEPAPGDRAPETPVSVEEHLDRILAAVGPLPVADVPLLDAVGLAVEGDVVAPLALPPFDNSAMDGYAVRAADVAGARDDAPVVLPVVGEIGAGQAQVRLLRPGGVAKIMTGAPVPSGADAVVPYEWTDRGAERVTIRRAPDVGAHVRPAGDDVDVGDLLVVSGTRLGPRHVGLLAAVGHATARVRPRPRVAVLSTGSELRDPGAGPDELGHDAIYDGNSYLLAAAVEAAGGVAHRVGIVPDSPAALLQALDDHVGGQGGVDAVVTSGGVSQGDYDVVKEALAPLGRVWFGPVAMQPGKPQGFGLLGVPDGGREVPIFTLPGNPVSSYLSFQVFVVPALRAMAGRTPVERPTFTGRLTRDVRSPAGRRQFLRARWEADGAGPEVGADVGSVTPVGGPGSHLLGGLAAADALVVVPEDVTEVAAGSDVSVLLLDRDF